MMGFYRYCVTFYSEEDGKEITKTGITSAEKYSEAVTHLASYYGDYNIMRFYIECIGSDEVYECETKDLEPRFY